MKRPNRIFCVVIFALGLTGCATTLHTIPTNYAMGTNEESVVIGRVTMDLSGGGVKPIGFFDRLNKINVIVENHTTGKSYEIVCDQGGSDSNFFVAILPGQYSVSKLRKGNLESSPPGRFEVGKGQVMYIGTLKFVGRGLSAGIWASVLAGRTTLPGDWLVEDEYLVEVKSFREKYPHISQEVIKSLIAQ